MNNHSKFQILELTNLFLITQVLCPWVMILPWLVLTLCLVGVSRMHQNSAGQPQPHMAAMMFKVSVEHCHTEQYDTFWRCRWKWSDRRNTLSILKAWANTVKGHRIPHFFAVKKIMTVAMAHLLSRFLLKLLQKLPPQWWNHSIVGTCMSIMPPDLTIRASRWTDYLFDAIICVS
jgi:hypothetical protein